MSASTCTVVSPVEYRRQRATRGPPERQETHVPGFSAWHHDRIISKAWYASIQLDFAEIEADVEL